VIRDLMATWGIGPWIAGCAVTITVLLGWIVFDVHREHRGRS
jgi:hypothetical protein